MDGILLIDKPPDVGSAEVVRRVKRFVKPARVGHLGTLDPFATGLLPILIGEATKLAQFLEHSDKCYQGVIALGAETDTLDRCGAVVRTAAVPELDRVDLDEMARRFTGPIEQVPPVYSAIKRSGVQLYKLARRGADPAPPPARTVRIHSLELTAADGGRLRFSLRCASGMYVRALARDIGIRLGSAAHLVELRRLETAGFSVADSHSMEDVTAAFKDDRGLPLIALIEALPGMIQVEVDEVTARRLRNGDASALLGMVKLGQGPVKAVCNGALVAIAQIGADRRIALLRVFAS